MRSVLITGGSGFLGGSIISALRKTGVLITAVGRNPPRVKAEWLPLDISQSNSLALDDYDTIIDCASLTSIGGRDYQVNICIPQKMTKSITTLKNVIYISTIDVYGHPTSLPLNEASPVNPLTLYAKSKIEAESIYFNAQKSLGFDLKIIRSSQLFGPGDTSNKVIPTCMSMALGGSPLQVYGGDELRDYVFIEDAAKFVVDIANSDQSGVFNLATGSSRSILEVVQMIAEISGVGVEFSPPSSKQYDLIFDTTKTKDIFQQKHSFEKCLSITWDHFRR